jgi:hypothetical protein
MRLLKRTLVLAAAFGLMVSLPVPLDGSAALASTGRAM